MQRACFLLYSSLVPHHRVHFKWQWAKSFEHLGSLMLVGSVEVKFFGAENFSNSVYCLTKPAPYPAKDQKVYIQFKKKKYCPINVF